MAAIKIGQQVVRITFEGTHVATVETDSPGAKSVDPAPPSPAALPA